ncbi:hypothetical protein [Deinococcus pimensis]|uniref:hypothetical protein n=1 Tax=Deinococcus pimensis TaxID=309888 RepID=UPI0012F75DA3|nr:hypothetical protein [Deinococcus pimensis]
MRPPVLLHRHLLPGLLLGATLVACGAAPTEQRDAAPTTFPVGTPTGDARHVTIGPEGGTLTSADGALTVTVPAGALDAPTDLSVQPITRTAPRAGGGAYRLGPEGVTFRQNVHLTFAYDPTFGGALSVASQDATGAWQAHLDTTQDRSARTVSVRTNHFSDWTWAEAFKLDPQQTSVKVGQRVKLTLVTCVGPTTDTDTLLAPLVTSCAPYTLTPFTRDWSVNGTAGGDATNGHVSKDEANVASGTYTAPTQKPDINPVAVSVDVVPNETGRNTLRLISNVTVTDDGGACEEVFEGQFKCVYPLRTWNGHDLPYNLPNTSPYGQTSRDRLTGGYLQLNASAEGLALGTGTYEIRYEFDHDAGGGRTDHDTLNDVGHFDTNLAGTVTTFTSVGKVTYTGTLRSGGASVQGFPMATPTFSGDVDLYFGS